MNSIKNTKICRRRLISLAAGVIATSFIFGKKAWAELVKETDPQAVAVKYVSVKSKLKDATLKKEKDGLAWDKQNCSNCAMYTGDRNGKDGPCAIFPDRFVHATGWCTVWTKAKT